MAKKSSSTRKASAPKAAVKKTAPITRYQIVCAPYNSTIHNECLYQFRKDVEGYLRDGATLQGGVSQSGDMLMQAITYPE